MNLSIDDFDYELPSDLIAQHPSETRSGSRLLCVGASLAGRRFSELPRLLRCRRSPGIQRHPGDQRRGSPARNRAAGAWKC